MSDSGSKTASDAPPSNAEEIRFPETKPTAIEPAIQNVSERITAAGLMAPRSSPPAKPSSKPPRRNSSRPPNPPIPGSASAVSAQPTERTSDPTLGRVSNLPVPAPDSLAPQQVAKPLHELPVIGYFGRFALLGRLAFGGMAEIFLAREENPQTGALRHIVVKRVLPHVADDQSFVQMFLDEARLAIRLQHPNICHIYEFGETDGSYFIAMEWINGVPLGKLLRKARESGGMSTRVATRIIAQVAEALHYAHRARDEQGNELGIVHRDVSLQNIMVSYEGTVKLLDFGVAKAVTHSTKTSAGVVKGKLSYMAPEQARGEEVDARADVFALGICLYEALTCRALYHRSSEYETLRAIIDGPVPSARAVDPNVPAALDAIVQRALQKEASQRYADAGEMQNALEMYLADQRMVVGSSQVREYLRTLYAEEMARGPLVESSPFVLPVGTPSDRPIRSSHVPTNAATPAASARRDEDVEPKKSRRPVIIAASLTLVALLGAITGATLLRAREKAAVTNAPPPALRVPVKQQPSEPAALPAPSPTPQEEDPIEWADPVPAPAPTKASPRPSRPAASAQPQERGTLSLNTRPWSNVYLGSRSLGMTPLGNVEVPAGEITLRLEDRDGNTHRRTLRIRANERTSEFFDLSVND